MALTTLDQNTALIVIDLQQGLAGFPTIHPLTEIAQRARQLADAFRARALPVVFVNVAGTAPGRTEQQRLPGDFPAGFTDLLPELDRAPTEHVVTKRSWGAFTNTDLAQHLRSLDITQIVLAGVATSIGVESTARQAHELGLNVTLATDAMTDTSEAAHANSITRIYPRLGETATNAAIIERLQTRA